MNEINKIIHVKVFPISKKERVIQHTSDTFDVYVREPAQKNLANIRVREIIAEHLGIPIAQAVIQTGHRARKKTFMVNTRGTY
ncbi:hypothetical protein CL652_01830 [bacterium]|nr:hypothetical protein [bacterium]|tara:strand:- start:34 stop:282 length:249 start_codon:yes stop_codon:yes gene_type:complete